MSDEGEIEISAHQISVEELCKMLNTNVESGLTDAQVKERQKEEKQGIDPEEDVPMAQVRRNGSLVEIPVADLVVGDIVEVKLKGPLVLYSPTDTYSDYYFGENIPADIRIVKADGFKVDEGNLTGDGNLAVKGPECTSDNPIGTANLAWYGTRAQEGSCVGIVYNVGSRTAWGKVSQLATPVGQMLTGADD